MRKFKNTKKQVIKKAKPQKLPRNSRIIPERIHADEFIFTLGILCIFAAILVVSANLYKNLKEQKALVNEKIKVLREEAYWENEIKLKPDFRDAYFSLALINYQLNDLNKANEYLAKTLSLDPNFEKGRELGKLLGNY